MEFRKIKHSDKTELTWTTSAGGEDVIVATLASYDLPEPEFREAFAALVPHVVQLLELPEDYGEGMKVTSVSIGRNDHQGLGVVITALKKISGAKAPLVINTPHVVEIDESGPEMTDALFHAIEELEARAARYVQGHRAQGDLFEEAA